MPVLKCTWKRRIAFVDWENQRKNCISVDSVQKIPNIALDKMLAGARMLLTIMTKFGAEKLFDGFILTVVKPKECLLLFLRRNLLEKSTIKKNENEIEARK